jgi:sulfatase modifying factor 1
VNRPAIALLLASVGAACVDASPSAPPPAGQVVLFVDTDAPVGTLFDRLRFDVMAPDGTSWTNEFPATADAFAAGAVSIGVAPPPLQDGWSARVRLFALDLALTTGEPNEDATIDVTVSLPAARTDGISQVTVFLATDATGHRAGQDTPVAPTLGPPGPSAVGSWPGAQPVDCAGAPSAGMVCVPGGAYWMGSSDEDFGVGTIPGWRRLVVVSPFYLDATEVTVAAARTGGIQTPIPWTGNTTGTDPKDWCTYTVSPDKRDALPLNCIEVVRARKFCQARGGDVPTEAQLEYVMGGLRGQRFVWGQDLPDCKAVVWGRNGFGFLRLARPEACLSFATALGAMGGPEVAGWGPLDSLALLGGTIVDLAGNVSELARDEFQTLDEPCWSAHGVLHDPECAHDSPSLGQSQTSRGGSWGWGGTLLTASGRQNYAWGAVSPYLGFRCMRAAQ